MSSTDAGFNLKKTPDSTKSVVINYLPIGLSSIFRDEQNKYLSLIHISEPTRPY